jgi:6,7-dimethyl-8-ribityllumazine synthase
MKTETNQEPPPSLPGARLLLVIAPYYREIAQHLERGARAMAKRAGTVVETISVPGAFEVPGAITLAEHTGRYDGYVGLGCVVRGETSHYDYVCGETARGLMDLSLKSVAIGYGILTVDTIEQALVRADPAKGDKGGESTRACLAMIALKRQLADRLT